MTQEKRTKAIVYCRVSTDKQAESGLSTCAQRDKCMQYAELYNVDVVNLFFDKGFSAKTLERPGLNAALRELKLGNANALLVMKLDRLTRSVTDLGFLLRS